MAKTKTTSTRSPFGFVPGDVATKDDHELVHEMQNAGRGDLPHNLLSLEGRQHVGTDRSPAGANGVLFPSTGTITVFRGRVYIEADLLDLAVRSVATLPASSTGSVIVTIGGGSVTNAHTAGATTTDNGTVATSSTGTGWQAVTVELRRDTGDPSTGTLDRARVRSTVIAASSLGDPV